METIRNYLETMFANLPDTPEVRRAKDELWQMMEDKYTELIENGESENTAVGTVISEFGNLDELADDLGLRSEVDQDIQEQEAQPRRLVTLEEVKEFLKKNADNANRKALGVFCCVICPIGPIIAAAVNQNGVTGIKIGVLALFLILAFAIACFIYVGMESSKWNWLKRERCLIDMGTTSFIMDEQDRYRNQNMMKLILGIILCALCWIPAMFLADVHLGHLNGGILSAAFILILLGLGVFLLVQNGNVKLGYRILLRLNERGTMAGGYVDDEGFVYQTEKGRLFMELYWPTVTAAYLIISFLTFAWAATWIIWPVAGVASGLLKKYLAAKETATEKGSESV